MRFSFLNDRYDIILDCAKQGPEQVRMKGYQYDTYVTLNSPMLSNFDRHGLALGVLQNLTDITRFNIPLVQNKGGYVKWGFFVPDQTGISVLQGLVDSGKVGSISTRISKMNLSRW